MPGSGIILWQFRPFVSMSVAGGCVPSSLAASWCMKTEALAAPVNPARSIAEMIFFAGRK
jgi:hypothetical protein